MGACEGAGVGRPLWMDVVAAAEMRTDCLTWHAAGGGACKHLMPPRLMPSVRPLNEYRDNSGTSISNTQPVHTNSVNRSCDTLVPIQTAESFGIVRAGNR